jgi:phosphoribosylformylglycinamidine (FGAM) synthase PurS component
MATLAFAVVLTIPDNEAFTAYEALARMGLPIEAIERADIWRFEVDAAHADTLRRELATIETIFNPNKHRLEERDGDAPAPGEVWVAPRDEARTTTVAGRTLPGVSAIRRATAWRVRATGADSDAVLDRAVTEFLCNPAFQKVLR